MPELHLGKCWYVDYYIWDHAKGRAMRKRIKVNKPRDQVRRLARARALVAELTRMLLEGWRPELVERSAKANRTLGQAVEAYIRHKQGELRHSSGSHYRSWTDLFSTWCREKDLLLRGCRQFSQADAIAYLDHCSQVRGYAPRTWNTHRVAGAMMFGWMIERGYRTDNPFKGIKARREERKFRTFLTEEERVTMSDWFCRHDPAFWVACLFVYHTLVRPRELARLRVEQVDLTRQVISMDGNQTKNGDPAIIAIPDAMMPWLTKMNLDEFPGGSFLMGKDFVPGRVAAHRNSYQHRWGRMRQALGWGPDKQFYSLRDTGIIQLLRDGCDLLHVMQQARHKDVKTTNDYLKHAFPKGIEEVRRKASPLAAPGR